ncbi:MAG: hypothetical protein KC418_24435, partial [Anaerolineales bacterium]|nr:hypothetical protein [Anaerolineales bacterium]
MKALFVDERLQPWRDQLPTAENPLQRVERVVSFLSRRQHHQTRENALVSLLQVLSERADSQDACAKRLADLAQALTQNRRRNPRSIEQSPFKGLQYFDVADAHLFWGRETLTASLVAHLRGHRFLAVVGASGSGKSSVVRAGVISALLGKSAHIDEGLLPPGSVDWPIYIIMPGEHPLQELAISLTRDIESVTATTTLMEDLARDPRALDIFVSKRLAQEDCHSKGLLLVVDQFEEMFTACKDKTEQRAFVDNLLTAVDPDRTGPTRVIMTLRADFYSHCAQFANLRQALSTHQVYIGPMNGEELRRAIEQPAALYGMKLEPELLETLLRDCGINPANEGTEEGVLPLLSHALLETWGRCRGDTLTHEDYRETGGVREAIAQTAESTYRDLTPAQQEIARNIFVRLTALGEGTPDTRRRASLSELALGTEQQAVIEAVIKILTDARLLITDRDTIVVIHEALIREWPTMRAWLEDNRERIRLYEHLRDAAKEWGNLERDPDALYRGMRLEQAVEAFAGDRYPLSEMERAFLEASREEEARRRAQEAAQRQLEEQLLAEQRAASRLRRLRNGLVATAVLLVVVAFFAIFQSFQANESARVAAAESTRAIQAEATALFQSTQANQSAQLAAAESTRAIQAEATAVFNASVAATAQAVAETESYVSRANRIYSEQLAEQSERARAETDRLWRIAHSRELAAFSQELSYDLKTSLSSALQAVQITYVEDGTYTAEAQRALYQVLAKPLFQQAILGGHTGSVTATFSPDGTYILTTGSWGDSVARLWDQQGHPISNLTGHTDGVSSASFSPDGMRIVTVSRGTGPARLWDVNGSMISTLVLGGNQNDLPARSWAWFCDRDLLGGCLEPSRDIISWSSGNLLNRNGRPFSMEPLLYSEGEPIDPMKVAVFGPASRDIVTVGSYGAAFLWDVQGHLVAVLRGHVGDVISASFSPNGRYIVTASDDWPDKTVRLWTRSGGLIAVLDGDNALFSPDGTRLLTLGAYDQQDALWDVTGHLIAVLGTNESQYYSNPASFSPDGRYIVTTSYDSAWLWDADGHFIAALQGHWAGITAINFSPNGQYIVTASRDNTARVWDVSGNFIVALKGHANDVNNASFNPDGNRIVTASRDGTARIWDTNGNPVAILEGHTDSVTWAGFSPDGQHILTASGDGTARLWDIDLESNVTTLEGYAGIVNAVTTSADGTRMVTAGEDGTIRLWNLVTGAATILQNHANAAFSAQFDASGTRIITAHRDGSVQLWDVDGNLLTAYQDHTADVLYAGFGSSDVLIITVEANAAIHLRDMEGQVLTTLNNPFAPLKEARLSPDGQRIVTISEEGKVQLWDVQGSLVASINHWAAPDVQAVAFSPQGTLMATIGGDSELQLWDAQDDFLRRVTGHEAGINSVAFDPYGRYIVTASDDYTARIWTMNGNEVAVLQGHTDNVISANFSPDGQHVVTVSDDGTARLWDNKGNFIIAFTSQTGAIISANFSADGSHVITTSEDGTIKLWVHYPDIPAMLSAAQVRVLPYLTEH